VTKRTVVVWSLSAPAPWVPPILPKLFPCVLLTGCSSSSSAPAWLHNTRPILQALLQHCSPWVAAPQPSCPTRGSSSWAAAPALSAPEGSPWTVPPSGLIHCFSVGFSMAVCRDLLCVVPVGCRETACSIVAITPELQGSSASCLCCKENPPFREFFLWSNPLLVTQVLISKVAKEIYFY